MKVPAAQPGQAVSRRYHGLMHLVILAAGHGRRFGGLKQLAEVGPLGEALIDYTAIDAFSCGFEKIVLIVREEIEDELMTHVDKHWPAELEREAIRQGPVAGTAQAVMSAAAAVEGPFGVVNADDLYGREALQQLRSSLSGGNSGDGGDGAGAPHSLVGYRLSNTVFGDGTVTRGVCRADPSGQLVEIVEQKVTPLPDGGGYMGKPLGSEPTDAGWPLSGDELVSMNLWGFFPRMFDHLSEAIEAFDPPAPAPGENPPELLLPNVVKDLVAAGKDRFLTLEAEGVCIGITHASDLEFMRRSIGSRKPGEVPDKLEKPGT